MFRWLAFFISLATKSDTSDCRSVLVEVGNARTTNNDPAGSEAKSAAMLWRIFRATLWRTTEFPTLVLIIKPQRAGSLEFER